MHPICQPIFDMLNRLCVLFCQRSRRCFFAVERASPLVGYCHLSVFYLQTGYIICAHIAVRSSHYSELCIGHARYQIAPPAFWMHHVASAPMEISGCIFDQNPPSRDGVLPGERTVGRRPIPKKEHVARFHHWLHHKPHVVVAGADARRHGIKRFVAARYAGESAQTGVPHLAAARLRLLLDRNCARFETHSPWEDRAVRCCCGASVRCRPGLSRMPWHLRIALRWRPSSSSGVRLLDGQSFAGMGRYTVLAIRAIQRGAVAPCQPGFLILAPVLRPLRCGFQIYRWSRWPLPAILRPLRRGVPNIRSSPRNRILCNQSQSPDPVCKLRDEIPRAIRPSLPSCHPVTMVGAGVVDL